MVSKTTKAVASRIPVDLFFQLQNEADALNMNMKDYLLKIIAERNQKKEKQPKKEKPEIEKIKKEIVPKKPKKKISPIPDLFNSNEIIFPE